MTANNYKIPIKENGGIHLYTSVLQSAMEIHQRGISLLLREIYGDLNTASQTIQHMYEEL